MGGRDRDLSIPKVVSRYWETDCDADAGEMTQASEASAPARSVSL